MEPNLQSLDIYAPKDAKNLPVMIYIHGGGWQRGDKAAVGSKPHQRAMRTKRGHQKARTAGRASAPPKCFSPSATSVSSRVSAAFIRSQTV